MAALERFHKWFFRLLRARAGSLPDAITVHG
jgi:hypothetical protein